MTGRQTDEAQQGRDNWDRRGEREAVRVGTEEARAERDRRTDQGEWLKEAKGERERGRRGGGQMCKKGGRTQKRETHKEGPQREERRRRRDRRGGRERDGGREKGRNRG